MIYLIDENITIRSLRFEDAQIIYDELFAQNWHPEKEIYDKYYEEQESGKRYVLVAEYLGQVAGYTTLLPKATIGPFAKYEFPEVVDLNVFAKYQKKGIANKILDVAENIASEISDSISLSVGLHWGYGAAHRIYIKRGYIPDGSGVWYKNRQLEQYSDKCSNDDSLVLYLSKSLK